MPHPKIHQPRIVLIAGIILIIVTLLAGVTVFIVMQRHAEALLSKSLQLSLQSRVQLTQTEIGARFDSTVLISTRPLMTDQLQLVDARADNTAARNKLNALARSFLRSGITAIVLYGEDGQELTRAGVFAQQPELVVPLKNFPGDVQLLWDGQLLLRAVVEIKKEGRVVGKVMTESSLPATMGVLTDVGRLGKTGEQALCAPFGLKMQCFPMALNPRVNTLSQRSTKGDPLPMAHALAGKTGFVSVRDYRHQEVVAAYAPVGDLGLGMVLKMDRAELFAPVWQQLRFLIPLLAGVLVIALLLLRWLLTPLVLRLVRSEAEAAQRTTALTEEVTERRRAQDEILRLNASLEERVQQRTEELQSQQEELRQSNEELEEKNKLLADQKVEVEYKNREIEAAKLTLEERAEQLTLTSKYKSEFLSSMSHELRTPLNSLLILAQLLAENAEHNMSEQQIEYAKTIQGAGKDLLTLINDILDLSKIESGIVTPDLQDVLFANVHEQVERGFRHVAESHSLGFGVELAPGLPPSLYTDAQRLQQVMKNLLSNAFKFTEKGQVSVRIAPVESGWSVDHDGLNRAETVIGFFVADSGIGLPADKQKIIFEAFQQADTGSAKKYGGTGLGLSISREIAWLLGGELHLVESAPGQGSTFVLYLPLRAPESGQNSRWSYQQIGAAQQNPLRAPESGQNSRGTPGGEPGSGSGQRLERDGESFAPKAARPDAAAQEAPQGSMPQETNPQPPAVADDRAAIKPGERTLLIIEDDARFADILLRAARDKGFKGIVAARGDDGLKLAGEFKPTAITLDLHLPDMNGWVVLERLKRNPDTRHIPVEIISAEDNRPRGLRYGAFEYLVKPVTAESLQKALADVKKFSEREVKDLLVADGDEQHRNNVLDLIGNGDVRIKAVASGKDALAALKKKRYDCIVLDLKLPDIPVADLLEAIQGLDLTRDVPVIVYGMDELPQQEQERLKSLALKGIVKEVRTPERLLDETALFLHRVVSKLPEERRQMLEKLYLSADSLAGKKVLVVDDDVRNIFALTVVLEHHKMAVIVAENGRAALEELGRNPDVDIVLMDIMMPGMDGYETMRQIRQMKQFESLPMIALTAKAMKGDREKCIAAGASDYVSKPVDTDQLVSLLRIWLYR